MRIPVTSPKGSAPSASQRTALLTLLVDDDPAVYQAVRRKILSYGLPGAEWLRSYRLSEEPRLRRRVREILVHLAREEADDRFLSFCVRQGEDFDLEQACWLLALTGYPEINVDGYQAVLDQLAGELREPIGSTNSAREILRVINRRLFDGMGFAGNEVDYYDPENSYLNRVIDRRMGNPISLCLLYLCLARRLRLPIVGIGMPGHFLCRFQSSTDEVFIDAFNRGRLLSKADCVKYLLQSSYGFREGLLAPASPRRVLLRVCSNLHQIYLHRKLKGQTERLRRYVVALAN